MIIIFNPNNILFSEALRKYPPGTVLRKCCTKSFRFPPAKANGSGPHLDVPEGMSVLIPILALHYDPKYFPEPDKFDPDRFTDEAKESRPKYCYLPFGDGPRQCLGNYFLRFVKQFYRFSCYRFQICCCTNESCFSFCYFKF